MTEPAPLRPFREPESLVDIDLFDMIDSFSSALDLINPQLDDHHKMVCHVATALAGELHLADDDYNDVFVASILHDIGAIAVQDRHKLASFEVNSPHLHAELGEILLTKFPPFARVGPLVRCHHVPWADGDGRTFRGEPVPLYAHLIHLADRIAVLVKKDRNVFEQVAEVRERINNDSGARFHPDFVAAFLETSRREVFWLDLASDRLDAILRRRSRLSKVRLDIDGLIEMSRFFSLIIDAKSRFTASHSSGVAASAEALARLLGMTDHGAKKIKVAGYLHDIGKLAVPDEVLEKPGKLSIEDWRHMHAHTYHTFTVLSQIEGLGEIVTWASDHHESLKGDGYPFHRGDRELPLGSRIIAVADVFTALAEDRPYREGLARDAVVDILGKKLEAGDLDRRVVQCVFDNYEHIAAARAEAQERETQELADFWDRTGTAPVGPAAS